VEHETVEKIGAASIITAYKPSFCSSVYATFYYLCLVI